MKAIIMAGGYGTRLRPLTSQSPKTMLPLVNKPALAHILNLLKLHHFSEVIITANYLADSIRTYFGDGRHWGMSICYVIEETPLGTAGSVKNVQPYLNGEAFLVISGDLITDLDLTSLVKFHHRQQALATLAMTQVTDPLGYGVIVTDQTGRIKKYVEKPGPGEIIAHTVNTGIYVFEPEVLNYMKPNVAYDFSNHIFPQMLSRKAPFFACKIAGYWCDFGTIKNYRQATIDILTGKVNHIDLGHHLGGDIWTGRDVEIGADVALRGPIYFGHQVKIRAGVRINGPTVVADRTIIGKEAQIEQSTIGRDCCFGERAKVQRCIIADQCHFAAGSFVLEKVIVRKNEATGVTTLSAATFKPERQNKGWL